MPAMLDLLPATPELQPEVGPLHPVRVAIVGLGRMGLVHAAVLSMLPDVTLVGAVDSQAGAARRLRGVGFRVPVWRALDDLLAQDVHAVWVCTPPDSHLSVTRRCLQAGAAGFVAKAPPHPFPHAPPPAPPSPRPP